MATLGHGGLVGDGSNSLGVAPLPLCDINQHNQSNGKRVVIVLALGGFDLPRPLGCALQYAAPACIAVGGCSRAVFISVLVALIMYIHDMCM